jgi:hypothetical protein
MMSQLIFTEHLFKSPADFDFNFYSMFVVDLLHEFELGVWKTVFTHLMHIFYAAGGTAFKSSMNSKQSA